jgi:hypothetical protein
MKKVQVPPEMAPVFWEVAQGKDLNSRGVYPNREACWPCIHGIRNSFFDEFKMEHEAWHFVFDNMEVDSNPKLDGTPRVSIPRRDPPISPPPEVVWCVVV